MSLPGKKVWNIVYNPGFLASVLLYPVKQAINVHIILNPNAAFHFSIISNIARLTPFIILSRNMENSLKFTVAVAVFLLFYITFAIKPWLHVVFTVFGAAVIAAVLRMRSSAPLQTRSSLSHQEVNLSTFRF